jgi:hypothetical protein
MKYIGMRLHSKSIPIWIILDCTWFCFLLWKTLHGWNYDWVVSLRTSHLHFYTHFFTLIEMYKIIIKKFILFLLNILTRLNRLWNFNNIKNILNFDVPIQCIYKNFRNVTVVVFLFFFYQKHFRNKVWF